MGRLMGAVSIFLIVGIGVWIISIGFCLLGWIQTPYLSFSSFLIAGIVGIIAWYKSWNSSILD